jgi:hypothetical protein
LFESGRWFDLSHFLKMVPLPLTASAMTRSLP